MNEKTQKTIEQITLNICEMAEEDQDKVLLLIRGFALGAKHGK